MGTQEGINIPIWIIVGFRHRDRQDLQNLTNVTFYTPPVTSAQSIIGTEKNPKSAILLNYNNDDYNRRYGQTKEVLKALTTDDILQKYISEHDFRSSNEDTNIGYNLYVFDIEYQKNLESAQPIKLEFKFFENVPTGVYGYGLVVTI